MVTLKWFLNTLLVLDPAPLGVPTEGCCLDYDADFRITTGTNCSIKFSYDGRYLRENYTNRAVCPESTVDGSPLYLSTSCTYTVNFAYEKKGGSTVCLNSTSLCLVMSSSTPGTTVTFRDDQHSLVTYVYEGTWIQNLTNIKDQGIWHCTRIVSNIRLSYLSYFIILSNKV